MHSFYLTIITPFHHPLVKCVLVLYDQRLALLLYRFDRQKRVNLHISIFQKLSRYWSATAAANG